MMLPRLHLRLGQDSHINTCRIFMSSLFPEPHDGLLLWPNVVKSIGERHMMPRRYAGRNPLLGQLTVLIGFLLHALPAFNFILKQR